MKISSKPTSHLLPASKHHHHPHIISYHHHHRPWPPPPASWPPATLLFIPLFPLSSLLPAAPPLRPPLPAAPSFFSTYSPAAPPKRAGISVARRAKEFPSQTPSKRPPNAQQSVLRLLEDSGNNSGSGRDAPKPLDIVPVATLALNVPAMYELHFAVPMAGGILCSLNSRLDASMISTLLAHSEAKVLFVDYQLLSLASEALHLLSKTGAKTPLLVLISDSNPGEHANLHYDFEYENLLAMGDDQFQPLLPGDEWDPISVNYTSGTTSRPKGVVYSHRGTYINAISTFLLHEMGPMPTYLWTVPMFHCSGWCLPWGVAAQGGTNICIRKVTPKAIFDNIVLHNVTHMSAAPTVLNMIVNSPVNDRRILPHKVKVLTGGSPPPPQVLTKMEEFGFDVSHLYGLTETYGPGTYCVWKPEWDSLTPDEKSRIKSRQGVQHLGLEDVDIRNPFTMESVPADGITTGEVMFKGNTVMSGYLKDLKATKEAFRGGWFHSGDLAVKHPDNYIEIKDRLKDIIISGGENISTVEVETVLYSHPAILEVAVVGRPDNHWGETPCAFVKLKDGHEVEELELIRFCRDHMAHYMAPKSVIFQDEIPKTATGKIQKFVLREWAKDMGSLT